MKKKKKAPRNALVLAMSSRRAAPMRDRRKRRPKDRREARWYED